MGTYLKTVSIALIAMGAMGLLAASASGESFWFKSDAGAGSRTVSDGTQTIESNDVFKVDYGAVHCKSLIYSGEGEGTGGTLTTVKVLSNYAACTLKGLPAEIDSMGCYFMVHTNEFTSEGFAISTMILCEGSNEITVTVTVGGILKCRLDIPPQTITAGIHLTNGEVSGVKDLTAHVSINPSEAASGGITYTQTEGSGFGRCVASEKENGTYIGEETFEGTNEAGEKTAIWVEAGEPEEEPEEPNPVNFHSEAEDTTLIGETIEGEEFVFNAGTAECSEAVFKGTMAAKEASEVSLAPEYGGCTAFGFSTAEVKPNGCTYTLHSGEKEEEKIEGSADIVCPEGKKLEVVARVLGLTKCTVTIGSQEGLTALTSTNQGSGKTRDLRFDIGLTGIAYTQDTGEGLGKCSSGSFENGKYTGAATVIGENAGKEQVGIWVE